MTRGRGRTDRKKKVRLLYKILYANLEILRASIYILKASQLLVACLILSAALSRRTNN